MSRYTKGMTLAQQNAHVAKGGQLPYQGPAPLEGHDLFLYELDLLCLKHNVILEHEDSHGSGLLHDAAPGEGCCGIAFCYEEYSQ